MRLWFGLDVTNINRLCGGIDRFGQLTPLEGWRAIASRINYPREIKAADLVIDSVKEMERWAKNQPDQS